MGIIIFEGIWLAVMSVWDAWCRRIPLWLLGIGIPPAVIVVAGKWLAENIGVWGLSMSLAPGILLLLAALLQKAGYGDGLVLILIGLMEQERTGIIFLMSLLIMSVFSVIALSLRKVKRNTRLPYLPFLMFGWFLGRIFG